ncbi:AAA-like domain-containing protein [Dapis sp. BLCC M172]|uniref:WD40 domain-containing protein n=1 Tax=Dapis sp. BLCC M172 TaxID=2975281 RepID=UPI003CF63DDB
MTNYIYQVGGSLNRNSPTYVIRKADTEIYQALKRGEFCYVLNCRQMGKSSLLVRTQARLKEEGFKCATVDMTNIGSENITPLQWYKGIVADLSRSFKLTRKVPLKKWWEEIGEISLLQKLSKYISDVLLVEFPTENLCIFIDEIDSILSLYFPIDDFFALIRYCYNQRAINPEYNRITFAIFGVATPSDLIQDRKRTPFNIGTAIELHGFTLEEIAPLATGLEVKEGNPKLILQEILAWTGGQPFLTQKLCDLVVNTSHDAAGGIATIPPGQEAFWVESIIRTKILHNWESQDEPEHLRTIKNRIEYYPEKLGRLLGIYNEILQGKEVKVDDSREQIELILSGLVVKESGLIKVRNRIYEEVFNLEWVNQKLSLLRPYNQTFDAWIESGKQDNSRLLRGNALVDAQLWANGKSLSDLDYQFLAASVELDREQVQLSLEAAKTREVEARLIEEQKRLEAEKQKVIQEKKTAKLQRFLLGTLSMALLVTVGLGVITFQQYRKALQSENQARLSEIKALIAAAKGSLASEQKLDALIQAIKAQKKLQEYRDKNQLPLEIEAQVKLVLQRAIYTADEYNRLSKHKHRAIIVAISNNGKTIATISAQKTIKLWQKNGKLLPIVLEHPTAIWELAFSPDDRIIASATAGGKIRLWHQDGKLHKVLTAHDAKIYGVAFSPNGETIASAGGDSTVKLWHRDGKLLRTLTGHQGRVWAVVFSPDGEIVVSTSVDGTVKIWHQDGRLLRTFKAHNTVVFDVAMSPDGEILATASDDKTVKLWHKDGRLLKTIRGHTEAVRKVVFSPDGKTLASASEDKTVKVWSLDGQLVKTFTGHQDKVWGVAYTPDGQTLISSSTDQTVRLWKPFNGLFFPLINHSNRVCGVAFSPDSKVVATTSSDKTIKLWHRNGDLITTLTGHEGRTCAVAFSPDGKTLASASDDRTIKFWSLDGELLKTIDTGHQEGIWRITFSPDGKILTTSSWDSAIKLWSQNGELLKTLNDHTNSVVGIAFSPDGEIFASASRDSTIKLWSRRGKLLKTLRDHSASVWGVVFSPDGKIFASASDDGTIKLWNRNGELLKTLENNETAIWEVAFSPDGNILATTSADNTVKLWHKDGRLLKTMFGHTTTISGIAFSPDGKQIASVSQKQGIIWDIENILKLDELTYACNWVRDYLQTNSEIEESDRGLCN